MEVPFIRIVDGLNEVATLNGASTVRDALDVFPVPPLVEVTEAESLKTPVELAVTLTTTVQFAPPARVPPAKAIELDPAVAVAVPPHVEVNPFGVATTSPVGKVSLNASPVKPTPPALLTVNVSTVEAFRPMVESLKAIAMTGVPPIDATSVAESLAEFVSPVTLTEAVLAMLDVTFEAI